MSDATAARVLGAPPAAAFREVARALVEVAGLSLPGGSPAMLEDALATAARERGEPASVLAARVAARDAAAVSALIEHALVTESAFWRHPEQLEAIARRAGAAPGPLAIWSAGCASGEEPCSVAIALLEAGRPGRDRIVATDLSARALAAARAGRYGPRALRHLPPALERWLEPADAAGVRGVRPEVRGAISFARQNLVSDPPPAGGPFDVVLCRNVLIHFEAPVAAAVLRRLAAALRPGGALVLGPVELPLAMALPLEPVRAGVATLLVRPR
ncbi:CheR family methyltransferase [Anaeromyxobacter oryzisoli]|uniref:CheR family methyltransferase n=1 Tax=Anaeromyxobacter oryzisoli TaxID=2925408 RepID=UPI001F57DB47|nr:CheR family methyltransferase [Anaeromyxobacter sp. SG63]